MLFWNSVVPHWNDFDKIQESFKLGNRSLNGYEHNVLFRNDGGQFTEIGHVAGVDSVFDSRGLGIGDLDADGDLDLLVTALRKPVALFDNRTGDANHWVRVRLEGSDPGNVDAVGARVRVRAGGREWLRELHAGSNFLSQSSPWAFIGLGSTEAIDQIEVTWPAVRCSTGDVNRQVQLFNDPPLDCTLVLHQGEKRFEAIQPLKLEVPDGDQALDGEKGTGPAGLPAAEAATGLVTLDGRPATLDTWHGKVLVVNFWATWCRHCVAEIPMLSALGREWADRGVVLVGISPESGSSTKVGEAAGRFGIDYPVLLAEKSFIDGFGGIRALPVTVVLDEQGKERFRHVGPVTRDQMVQVLREILPATAE